MNKVAHEQMQRYKWRLQDYQFSLLHLRIAMPERYMLWLHVMSVRVGRNPVFYRNDWTDRAGFDTKSTLVYPILPRNSDILFKN